MNREMKPGPFRRLLDRAQAAGLDITGWSPANAEAYERRVNEAEVRQAARATAAAVRSRRSGEDAGSAVSRVCRGLGLDVDNLDHREHVIAFMDATLVMVERENKYQGLWKQSGADDNAQNLYSKAQRVRRGLLDAQTLDQAAAFEDDLKDIINYAIFTLINIRAGRLAEVDLVCRLCQNLKTTEHGPCDSCGKLDRRPQE